MHQQLTPGVGPYELMKSNSGRNKDNPSYNKQYRLVWPGINILRDDAELSYESPERKTVANILRKIVNIVTPLNVDESPKYLVDSEILSLLTAPWYRPELIRRKTL